MPRKTPGHDKPRRDVNVYADVLLRQDRMCMCGMLAAEYATLPTRAAAGNARSSDAARPAARNVVGRMRA